MALFAGLFVLGLGLTGCQVEVDSSGKTRCFIQTDCLVGFECVASFCQPRGGSTPDTSVGQDSEASDFVDQRDGAAPDTGNGTDTRVGDTEPGRDALTGLDEDLDLVDDGIDNCRGLFNPSQEDFDNNGTGDLCQEPERTALVISEVLLNPEAGLGSVHEPALEYVEIYNAGNRIVDVTGFELSVISGKKVVIPPQNGEANRVGPGGFFVISGSPVETSVGQPAPGWVHGSPDFILANGVGSDGQTVYERLSLTHPLVDGGSLVVDVVELLTPSPRGRAWILMWDTATGTLPGIGNNSETVWCEAWYAPGDGRDAGSPGASSGPCYKPAQLQCDSSPGRELPLFQAVSGDLVEDRAGANSLNHCPSITTPALGRDLIFRLEVDQETPVELVFHPIPNIEGDQSDVNSALTIVPWYHLLYWREGACPAEGIQFEPSVCLQPSDGVLRTTLLLKKGVTYYFAVDGHAREETPLSPEAGRFTLRLSPL